MEDFKLKTADGIDLYVRKFTPKGAPKAAVQIQHGLAEHGARYERFAKALNAHGYVVYAPDGRASGISAAGEYGNWGPDGWAGWVNDIHLLNQKIREDYPGLPVALFGHSLGSFGAQHYLLDYSDEVDAVILSGTGDVATLVTAMAGDEPADLSAFNAPFEFRTGYEWLSRDEAEVDKYVADPACGWAAPMPDDLTSAAAASDLDQVLKVRDDLPIMLVSGSMDPVGGVNGEGPIAVGERYKAAGVVNVEVNIYPEARHELLNETNREEVTADILEFLDGTVGA